MNIDKIIKTIEKEFENGKIKQIGWNDMITRLEEIGIDRNDIDDAFDEAERRKIIEIEGGYCRWIDPSLREKEKTKTQRYYEILADIFKHGKIDFLPKEDVKLALKERGFNDEEIIRILAEADRDFVLHYATRGFGPEDNLVAGCSWIPAEERKTEEEAEKRHRKWFEKWLEKKVEQEETWEE